MKISKKAAVLAASYILSAFAVLGGVAYVNGQSAAMHKRSADNNYQHAFSELVTAMDEVDTALQKCTYSTSPAAVTGACTDVFGKAMSAQMALGVLPFKNNELEHTAAFLSKVGDYAYAISRSAASGSAYTKEQYDNLRKLSSAASSLSASLRSLYDDIDSGRITIRKLNEAEDELGRSDSQPGTLADSYKVIESEFPEVPSLIYDGPFSDHLTSRTPKMLENQKDISNEEALSIAAKFCALDESEFEEPSERGGRLPVIVLTGGDRTVEITRAGGQILFYRDNRATGSGELKPEKAVAAAKEFLSSHNYSSMEPTYWIKEDGRILINFAYSQDGVLCYPDLIKVAIASDSGKVVGLEAKGYLTNHMKRRLPQTLPDPHRFSGKLSKGLTVTSSRTAIIPTAGENEVLCCEYICENEDGRQYIVYVNAETGNEEKILILLQDENGTLVQ